MNAVQMSVPPQIELTGTPTVWLTQRNPSAGRGAPVEPTHRSAPKPARHWRTRKDPFEEVWPTILGWLETDPDQTARQLLARLQQAQERYFPDAHEIFAREYQANIAAFIP